MPATCAEPPNKAEDWPAVLSAARGQTVYWHAWAGSTAVNRFVAWVGEQVQGRYGIRLQHVKLADTGDAVSRILAEHAAGRERDGAVDLIWINGPHFAALKRAGLLYGPFAESLPNWRYVDVERKPVQRDFGVPTEGMESPWASAQVVFMYDTADLHTPLPSVQAIAAWAEQHPGRFTYPLPADFLGATFLKQALIDLLPDPSPLQRPVEQNDAAALSAPLWRLLDRLHPHLWRAGRAFPASGPAQLQLLADEEIDLAIAFGPAEASRAIAAYELPPSIRTFVLDKGSLGNVSFVAIPHNASAAEAAMVVADFLLSPEAQLRAQDPRELGFDTVLDIAALPVAQAEAFAALDRGPATLSAAELGRIQAEPHPSWMSYLQAEWARRYAAGGGQ